MAFVKTSEKSNEPVEAGKTIETQVEGETREFAPAAAARARQRNGNEQYRQPAPARGRHLGEGDRQAGRRAADTAGDAAERRRPRATRDRRVRFLESGRHAVDPDHCGKPDELAEHASRLNRVGARGLARLI